jgi:hypothetical protein
MESHNADCLLRNPAQDFGNASLTGRPDGLLAEDPPPLDPRLTPSGEPEYRYVPAASTSAGAWRFFLAPGKWLD